MVDSDSGVMLDSDEPTISRSNSVNLNTEGSFELSNGRTRATRWEKGKIKDNDTHLNGIKQEPKTISLHSPEPGLTLVCSSAWFPEY
jgi:hypothetical protein